MSRLPLVDALFHHRAYSGSPGQYGEAALGQSDALPKGQPLCIMVQMNHLAQHDPEVWAAVAGEIERQQDGLEMIASENYTSPAVHAGLRQRADEQVRRGLSRAAATMAAASLSTWSKIWPATA